MSEVAEPMLQGKTFEQWLDAYLFGPYEERESAGRVLDRMNRGDHDD
jgi:hypothetical protein